MGPLILGFGSIRRSIGLAATIIVTLGIALAASVTVFSFLNSFLLRPLPYGDSARIVVIYEQSLKTGRGSESRVTFGNFVDLQERATSFSRLGLFRNESVTVRGASGTEVDFIQRVTPDIFPMIGVRPALGAVISPTNAEIGGVHAVLLSDSLWRRRFGGDPSIVGQVIQLDDRSYQVVGVLPADFRVPSGDNDPQAWVALLPADYQRDERTQRRHHVWAELAPGKSLAAAQAELDSIGAQVRAEHPQENANRALVAYSLRRDLLGDFDRHLVLLQGAVFLVLIVACLNCLCLLVARAIERRREFAVRLALGATRAHLLVQLLAEAAWLAVPAAVLGCTLAAIALPYGIALVPNGSSVNVLAAPRVDFHVILAVAAAAAVVLLAFAAVPLLQVRRLNIEATLRSGGRSPGSANRAPAARWLAGAQIAVALSLLICATLLMRSQRELAALNPGLPIREIDTFRVGLRGSVYTGDAARRLQFYDDVLTQLRQLPGVSGATAANFVTNGPGSAFVQEGDGLDMTNTPKRAVVHAVAPNFFSVLDLKVPVGRALNDDDVAGHAPAVVINARMAEKYWGGPAALGKRVSFEGHPGWFEIVGICADTWGTGDQPQIINSLYVTLAQAVPPGLGMGFLVRHTGPAPSERDLQQAVWHIDPDMQFFAHNSLSDQYEVAAWQSHFVTQLVIAFASLAVIMSLAGIYAVNSFLVARRITEFGVRAALGATQRNLLELVLGESVRLATVSIIVGIGLALLASRGLTTLLYGVSTVDFAAYASAAVLMIIACTSATLLPARRAARVDPQIALRAE